MPQYTGVTGIRPDFVHLNTNPDAVLEIKGRGYVAPTEYDAMRNIVGGQRQLFSVFKARKALKGHKNAEMYLRKVMHYSKLLRCDFVALWDGDYLYLYEFWDKTKYGQLLVLSRNNPDFLPTYVAWLNRALRRNGNGFDMDDWAARRQARAAARLPRPANWGPKGPVRPKWLKKRARNGHRSS